MQRLPVCALALTAIVIISGCGGQQEAADQQSPAVSAAATPSMPDLDHFTPPPTGYVDDHTGEQRTPIPVPTWDSESRKQVVEVAENAMRAFARPDLSYDAWWAGFEPFLNDRAVTDYVDVDPANIHAGRITGPARLTGESSAYLGRVDVPTDVGTYSLILNRVDANAPWLIARITPPEGIH